MTSNGYVYVLLNPSIQDVVKIGMTTRDPEKRVLELSSATGVPTPFILVFKEYFDDCYLAERKIHTLLEEKKYRVSNNREFFYIPVHEAISLIQEIKNSTDGMHESEITTRDIIGKSNLNELADDLFGDAMNHLYGENGVLSDIVEALELFQKALKLGKTESYVHIGDIYYVGLPGRKPDYNLALDNYKMGAKNGYVDCFAKMAEIYSSTEMIFNSSNAQKCWDFYFGEIENSIIPNIYVENYLYTAISNNWEPKHGLVILEYKDEIIDTCVSMIGRLKPSFFNKNMRNEINIYNSMLKYIEKLERKYSESD